MIPKKLFGRTGHESTRVLFGAAALWSVTQVEADATLDVLLEHGINHIDTAASYGEAERRIGPWMKHHRDQFFLAWGESIWVKTRAKISFRSRITSPIPVKVIQTRRRREISSDHSMEEPITYRRKTSAIRIRKLAITRIKAQYSFKPEFGPL